MNIIDILFSDFIMVIGLLVTVLGLLEVLAWAFLKFHKSQQAFDIRDGTVLDKDLEQPDSYEECDWYPEYRLALINVFQHQIRAPFTYWKAKPIQHPLINIDKYQHRHTWSIQSKETNTPHIACFGGSTLWGWGARDDFTIPSCLAKKYFEKTSQPVAITNHGQIGYVSTQGVISLIQQLQQNNIPDVVIFYDGLNDMFSTFRAGVAGIAFNEASRDAGFEKPKPPSLKNYITQRSSISTLYQSITQPMIRQTSNPYENANQHMHKLILSMLDVYFANVNIVKALGKQYGFATFFFWQPILFGKQHRTNFEEKIYQKQLFWLNFYQQTTAILQHNYQSVENFYDLSAMFTHQQNPLFIDPWHLNERGNDLIATKIYQTLTENGILSTVAHRATNVV